jgi:hypothetical protein
MFARNLVSIETGVFVFCKKVLGPTAIHSGWCKKDGGAIIEYSRHDFDTAKALVK